MSSHVYKHVQQNPNTITAYSVFHEVNEIMSAEFVSALIQVDLNFTLNICIRFYLRYYDESNSQTSIRV